MNAKFVLRCSMGGLDLSKDILQKHKDELTRYSLTPITVETKRSPWSMSDNKVVLHRESETLIDINYHELLEVAKICDWGIIIQYLGEEERVITTGFENVRLVLTLYDGYVE